MHDDRPRIAPGLEAHEVDDGLVVYDGDRDRVHYLNATASVVYTLCDGERTVDEITTLVGEAWELAEPPVAAVDECVAQLRGEGVLV